MSFLAKLRQLPAKKRKIILWSVIVVLALVLLFFWAKNFQQRIKSFEGGKLLEGWDFPEIKMPSMPEIDEQELEKLKQASEEAEVNGQ